ncbi:MAG: TIR domain-containing protein [Deltaproteobacteria bacterium]|nr:TIR domain-containing protein [Deltaproteobacteria bacterium]
MDDQPDIFDVFLCYNSQDKPVVRTLAESLQKRGLNVWLDEWELIPGRPWQEALEIAIEERHFRAAAVLVGPNGIGPWSNKEMRAFLSEFINCDVPIIPVLLPGAPSEVKLPVFLRSFTWVDLRPSLSDKGLDRLIWGITGRKPASTPADSPKEPDPASPKIRVQGKADSTQVKENPETSAPVSDQATPRSDANSRFTDNGNGTVTDQKTGLIWLKNANCFGRRTWDDAVTACQNLADGQYEL